MAEVLNCSGLHNDGKPELRVGIRGNEFIFTLNSAENKITLKNLFTQKKLSLQVDEVLSTNIYTKDEVDTIMSNVMTYHGTYETYQAVLDAATLAVITPKKGWVVFIKTAGGTDMNGTEIPANSHITYNGEGWVIL